MVTSSEGVVKGIVESGRVEVSGVVRAQIDHRRAHVVSREHQDAERCSRRGWWGGGW